MSKSLFIAEKPSVAREFAQALKLNAKSRNGYLEGKNTIITWCVGHLVTMSYPDAYDPKLKKWTMETLPFLPSDFKYEVIPGVKKQFDIVKQLLNDEDVDTIYVCTDSGREGEYIYRLVDQLAKVPNNKTKKRIWIDSQTEEEIIRGIKEAKPLSEYDNLSESAYLRAKEDYLMGINFSRILTLKYGNEINTYLGSKKWQAIPVGRVMTCVLGMVVRRERDIRDFVKTPFYRVLINMSSQDREIQGEFKAIEGSKYFETPLLYKDNGFLKEETAKEMIESLIEPNEKANEKGEWENSSIPKEDSAIKAEITGISRKKENKNPPLLYNLAELQNECSKIYKISPGDTLKIAQELYEKKMVTYPRTDARVISTAVGKEIYKNINGLKRISEVEPYISEILEKGSYKNINKTRYVNDKQITDHYAIIPTGQGLNAMASLNSLAKSVYLLIIRRFISIFYPPAVYRRVGLTVRVKTESFVANFRVLESEGYLEIVNKKDKVDASEMEFLKSVSGLKKGMNLPVQNFEIKQGETSPPKRYNSGSLILAMENAGQLIEDEELRAQIKGSGIGTSATRAEILNKLTNINHLNLNKKTQIMTPTLNGEMIYDVVNNSIASLLNPELTASWEKGLTYVADGEITTEDYMKKLESFVGRRVNAVKTANNSRELRKHFDAIAIYYK